MACSISKVESLPLYLFILLTTCRTGTGDSLCPEEVPLWTEAVNTAPRAPPPADRRLGASDGAASTAEGCLWLDTLLQWRDAHTMV